MDRETETHEVVSPIPREPIERNFWLAWLVAWLGISLAGGIFGLVLAGTAGLAGGVAIAGGTGAPVVVTVAIAAWAFWLSQFHVVAAIIAGACTGAVSTWIVAGVGDSFSEVAPFALIAGLMGAFGGGLASYINWQKVRSAVSGQFTWHFSLRDLFIRFTALAALIAAWSLALTALSR